MVPFPEPRSGADMWRPSQLEICCARITAKLDTAVGRIIPTNGMMPRVILFFVATPMAPPPPGRVFSSRGWDIATTTRPGLCQRSHHVLRPSEIDVALTWSTILWYCSLFLPGQKWCGTQCSNAHSHQKGMYIHIFAWSSSISKRYQRVIYPTFRHKKKITFRHKK